MWAYRDQSGTKWPAVGRLNDQMSSQSQSQPTLPLIRSRKGQTSLSQVLKNAVMRNRLAKCWKGKGTSLTGHSSQRSTGGSSRCSSNSTARSAKTVRRHQACSHRLQKQLASQCALSSRLVAAIQRLTLNQRPKLSSLSSAVIRRVGRKRSASMTCKHSAWAVGTGKLTGSSLIKRRQASSRRRRLPRSSTWQLE